MKNNIFKFILFINTTIIIFFTFPAFLICMYEKYNIPIFLNIYNRFNFSYSYEFRSARFLYNHIFVVICLLTTLTFASLDIFTSLKNSKSKIVNDCEQYLFSVSDENWLNFCLFFNECVQTYGKVDEELHYFRLKLNRAPATLEEMMKISMNLDNDSKWVLFSPEKTAYHMYDTKIVENEKERILRGEYNLKFVSSKNTNNMYEAVYNEDGILLTIENDPTNCATYNYCSDEISGSLHQKLDVKPYKKYGNISGYPYKGDQTKKANISKFYNNSDAQKNRKKYVDSKNFIIGK